METIIKEADILVEAIPYIKKFVGEIVVIKYGGIDGEWIRHKSACLIITKNDGNYSIAGNGTGW